MSTRAQRKPRRRGIIAFAAIAGVFGTLVAGPGAAVAAAPVYEITGKWGQGTPRSVTSGDVVNAEWHVNVNDSAAAPANDPVDDVRFSVTITNGVFSGLPDSCLTTGVTPASSISADGKTLTCNLGTQKEGTAHAVNTPIRADGPNGAEITATGTVDGGTASLDPIAIVNTFGMDMAWDRPSSNVTIGDGYADMDFEWTLFLKSRSQAGPDSISYTIDASDLKGDVITPAPTSCGAFTSGSAPGHPYSGGTHAADQMAPFVGSCTVTPTGKPGQFTVTLTGIDYSLATKPTRDSAGNALRTDAAAVASGRITLRVATKVGTTVSLKANAPVYTAPGSGATATDKADNNQASKVLVFPGSHGARWIREFTKSGGTSWDDSYRVSPGRQVAQTANGDLSRLNLSADTLVGECTVLDSAFVTFDSAEGMNWDTGKYPVQYYVGEDANVDPTSAAYDPNGFDCGTGGNSSTGGNGWVTSVPADHSTVKAVRGVFPLSAMDGYDGARANLTVQSTLHADAKAGQDVWMWGTALRGGTAWDDWSRPSAKKTVTPDARYPYTTVMRDIFRVVAATPDVVKSVDRSLVQPGVPATYTLLYSANAAASAGDSVDGYELDDTLPRGMTYVPGSAHSAPQVSTDGQGRQVLVWKLDGVPLNTQIPLTYQAVSNGSSKSGTVLTNTVDARLQGITASSKAQVVVATNGYTSIAKVADLPYIPNIAGDGDGDGSWTVTMRSHDALTQSFTDTIDVLPYNGDGRGTKHAGRYSLTGVDASAGATVYYTTANPASLSDDPAASANGAAGDPRGNSVGWSTTYTAAATAVRVIGPALEPGTAQSFTVKVATDGFKGGDVLVNRAQGRAGRTELVMRTSASISLANYYSAALTKQVQDADGVWHDADTAEDYPSFRDGDTVHYRITVTNTGQGTLHNIVVDDDRYPQAGGFTIGMLAPGQSTSHEYSIVLGDPVAGDSVVNTACATADTPADSGVAPTINCNPAGITVDGAPTHKKSLISAEPIGDGQWKLVYGIDVTNRSVHPTSYTLSDTLGFTDQVTVESAKVTESPAGVALASPAWNGRATTLIAANVALLGNKTEGYSAHHYEVTVIADAPLHFDGTGGDSDPTQCKPSGGDGAGYGFFNASELTDAGGNAEHGEACAPIPSIKIAKSVVGAPVQDADGNWTITYRLTATNDGNAAGVYTLADRLRFGAGIQVHSAKVSGVPAGVTLAAGWTGEGVDGSAKNVIAEDVALGAGKVHVYTVRVVASVDTARTDASSDVCPAGGQNARGAFNNTTTITSNDLSASDAACATPRAMGPSVATGGTVVTGGAVPWWPFAAAALAGFVVMMVIVRGKNRVP